MLDNGLMMQYFEWYMKSEPALWETLKKDADKLKRLGVTSVWLPPAYKGAAGIEDTGYDPYDLYDLGEFNQKGSVRTKYGTKKQYIDAIEAAHQAGINVYGDLVINRKLGEDAVEEISSEVFNASNRCQMIAEGRTIGAPT
ncbi:MAG: alpha-amylase, partial [Eubacterium sp.]|nr:alpha-amylase [Eubacterium sp.]